MAGKGGGAWKVAYADFVTAMMAFFLVMWLCAQDQQVKQSVADYFSNPTGASKQPNRTGAVMESQTSGSVPLAESVAMGKGRHGYTAQGESGRATKAVGDWLRTDEKANRYWREQAQRQRELAAHSREVRDKVGTLEEVAAWKLAKQLQEELTQEIPSKADGLYQNLLFRSFAEVNWEELARDLLTP